MGGQIIDASLVAVPIQRNSRDENARIVNADCNFPRSAEVKIPTFGSR
jgi:hypothetical protein